VAPVHRMAKAVAIIPVGHDFPPFSANKGGTIEGNKMFLLTYDLAFQIQEQITRVEAGGELPGGVGTDAAARRAYIALLRRLLRQWAIPPARQFNRLPSRARVVMCAGLPAVWQYSRGAHESPRQAPAGLPPLTTCQVMNHTPAGYALRQVDPHPAPLSIGALIALKVEGRSTLQVALVRWFRNTLKGSGLEFGCELLSDTPEAAGASPEGAEAAEMTPVVVVPEDRRDPAQEPAPAQVLMPAGVFAVEQAVMLKRARDTGFAVLTKLVEQGPGFELYEFVKVA
jgi:cyclic-di-GMP-binding protein